MNYMFFLSEEIELFKALYAERTIELYDLHIKYRLSPAQVANIIEKYSSEKLIKVSGLKASLTDKGVQWLEEKIPDIFMKSEKYWKAIPIEMQTNKIEINSLYTPNRSFFKKKGNCVNKKSAKK